MWRTGDYSELAIRTPRVVALLPAAAIAAFLSICVGATAVSLQQNTPASDADVSYLGGHADELPSAIATGRWNEDAFDDVLLCSWLNNSCWLFYGGPPAFSRELAGDVLFIGPAGGFGGSATFVGDVNGDGFNDLAIGAPTTAGAGAATASGSLWVFFGRAGATAGSFGYYDADLTIFSTRSYSLFGSSASAAGDMNGDGVDDFWVSAPNYNGTMGEPGSLFLFLGNRSLPASLNETVAAQLIEGVVPPASGGHVLLGARDLNLDGTPDLVVSSGTLEDASGSVTGAAHVFLGPMPRADTVLNTTDADLQIWGSSTVPSFGSSLAFAENFTEGGTPTLVIGADYGSGPQLSGAVYLFNTSGFACCQQLFPWDADGLIYSIEAGDGTGRTLATGDFDGDGRVDLAVGAPLAPNARGQTVGRVYLFYGNMTGRSPMLVANATGWVEGRHPGGQFGRHLTALNLNNDGKADFLVGAPSAGDNTSLHGTAYAFLGRLRNRAPVVAIDLVAHASEGDVLWVSLNATDPDRDRLTWWWTFGIPELMDPHTNATKVELVYVDDGSYHVEVLLWDGEYYVQGEASIVIANLPPSCEIYAKAPFVEGVERELGLNVTDPGGRDLLNITWSGPPELNASQLSARYAPPRGHEFEVQVSVRDNDGAASVCTITVPVENVAPTVSVTGPNAVLEGEPLNLSADATDPGGYEALSYSWQTTFGIFEGPSLDWVPTSTGNVLVKVTAWDLDGGNGTATFIFRVIGRAPQVELVIATGTSEGDPVNLTVEQVDGSAYDTLSYAWSVCSYGDRPDGGPVYAIKSAYPGRFCVQVRVTDEDGESVDLDGFLGVVNRAPLDGLAVSPDPPYYETMHLTFTPLLSANETALPHQLNYSWSVDGVLFETSYEFRISLPAGEHRVAVEAIDPAGGMSRHTFSISITNVPPVVAIEGPREVQTGALMTWRATASDPSGGEVQVEWEIDGQRSAVGNTLNWSSRAPGIHEIRAYAMDSGGAVASAVVKVEVSGPPVEGAGIEGSWIAFVVGSSAAFAAGIVLGTYVLDRLRNRRKDDG